MAIAQRAKRVLRIQDGDGTRRSMFRDHVKLAIKNLRNRIVSITFDIAWYSDWYHGDYLSFGSW